MTYARDHNLILPDSFGLDDPRIALDVAQQPSTKTPDMAIVKKEFDCNGPQGFSRGLFESMYASYPHMVDFNDCAPQSNNNNNQQDNNRVSPSATSSDGVTSAATSLASSDTPMMTPPVSTLNAFGLVDEMSTADFDVIYEGDASQTGSNMSISTPRTATGPPPILAPGMLDFVCDAVGEEAKPMYCGTQLPDPTSWAPLFDPIPEPEPSIKKEESSQFETFAPLSHRRSAPTTSTTDSTFISSYTSPITDDDLIRSIIATQSARANGTFSSAASEDARFEAYASGADRSSKSRQSAPAISGSGSSSGTGDRANIKRLRNTEAARRSRARKMERMIDLERRCDSLSHRNHDLEIEVLRLRLILSRGPVAGSAAFRDITKMT